MISNSGRQYFGETVESKNFDQISITETRYLKGESIEKHAHNESHLLFITSGHFTDNEHFSKEACEVRDLIVYPKEREHEQLFHADKTSILNIKIPESWISRYEFQGFFSQYSRISNPTISDLLSKVYYELRLSNAGNHLMIECILIEIFDIISKMTSSKRYEQNWITKVIEYLTDNFHQSISLEKLAKELQVHPVHLSRYFKAKTGRSPGEYLKEIRIRKSIDLLSSPSFSFTDVCYSCGYYDQSHFNRNFKLATGFTPTEYKALL